MASAGRAAGATVAAMAARPAPASATAARATGAVGLVWFKQTDLRLIDHEPLVRAHRECAAVAHVFVFDPHWFGSSRLAKLPRMSHHRAKFLLQAVADLRNRLRERGSELLVRTGPAAKVVSAVAAHLGATSVYTHQEVASEELAIDAAVSKALAQLARPAKLITLFGGTLYRPEDLPFDARRQLPSVYSSFRRSVEASGRLQPPVPIPSPLRPAPPLTDDGVGDPATMPWATIQAVGANRGPGQLPSLAALGASDLQPIYNALHRLADNPDGLEQALPVSSSTTGSGTLTDAEATALLTAKPAEARAVLSFVGGETAALARLRSYLWETHSLRTYKETRNGLLGANYSSKFSAWLATGSISARTIAEEVRDYERRVVANDSTYWLIFELLWRDYFRYYALAHGTRLFKIWGPRNHVDGRSWSSDPALFSAWCLGRSGYPFVDANMRELLLTGFMSNRGRQNVASFFVKDMSMDWRIGAEWFEALLIDHDVGSNYGNWTYVAGVGADPREDRYFLIPKQSRDYDRQGQYMRHWLPELATAPLIGLHEPQQLGSAAQKAGYPAPVVVLLANRQPRHSSSGASSARPDTVHRRPPNRSAPRSRDIAEMFQASQKPH